MPQAWREAVSPARRDSGCVCWLRLVPRPGRAAHRLRTASRQRTLGSGSDPPARSDRIYVRDIGQQLGAAPILLVEQFGRVVVRAEPQIAGGDQAILLGRRRGWTVKQLV